MAGYARRDAISSELARRTSQTFMVEADDEAIATTLDYVCMWLENGQTLKALAAELQAKLHLEVSPGLLQRTLDRQYGQDNVAAALSSARVRASHNYAEQAIELVDAPAETQVEVSRAASRARSRQWLAERYNPREYGGKQEATVTINIGSMHLAALQHARPNMPMLQPSTGASIGVLASSSVTLVEDAQVVD